MIEEDDMPILRALFLVTFVAGIALGFLLGLLS